jgi:hypothetical protein
MSIGKVVEVGLFQFLLRAVGKQKSSKLALHIINLDRFLVVRYTCFLQSDCHRGFPRWLEVPQNLSRLVLYGWIKESWALWSLDGEFWKEVDGLPDLLAAGEHEWS